MSRAAQIKKFIPVETYPIFAVVGGAVAGAGYYLYRLSQGPEVVWNRHSDWKPWNKIEQHENIKFMTVHPTWWKERVAAAKVEGSN